MHCLLHALAAMHALDTIHRDVKADNLLLNAEGSRLHYWLCVVNNVFVGFPKLADFGVSGQMASPLTSMVGTPAFIAPEVVGAKPGDENGYNEKVRVCSALPLNILPFAGGYLGCWYHCDSVCRPARALQRPESVSSAVQNSHLAVAHTVGRSVAQ